MRVEETLTGMIRASVDAMPERPIARTCAYCPDHRERTARLMAEGYAVSHGICPSCWPEARRLMGLPPAPYPVGGR